MKKCVICSVVDSKYKCPICSMYYCSVKCCKEHKEIKCQPVVEPKKIERQEMEFLTEDTVPEEKLQLLEKSEDLRNLLRNPHLRNYLKDLDNSSDPEIAIRNAMLESLFIEFADVCLKIVEPPERD